MSTIKNLPPNANAQSLKQAQEKKESRDPRMLEAAQSFENQFIRQMISEMRKTVPKDELIPESMGERIFKDQLDDEYADKWVHQGGIGLTELIYDQLQSKYGGLPKPQGKGQGEFLGLKQPGAKIPAQPALPTSQNHEAPRDIFAKSDRDLFLAKHLPGGLLLKSREPLPENVSLHSPLSGIVLQSSAMDDGRKSVIIKHDQGLVTQIVHSGQNNVKSGDKVDAGTIIAQLPPSLKGESANVFFGLRKQVKAE